MQAFMENRLFAGLWCHNPSSGSHSHHWEFRPQKAGGAVPCVHLQPERRAKTCGHLTEGHSAGFASLVLQYKGFLHTHRPPEMFEHTRFRGIFHPEQGKCAWALLKHTAHPRQTEAVKGFSPTPDYGWINSSLKWCLYYESTTGVTADTAG